MSGSGPETTDNVATHGLQAGNGSEDRMEVESHTTESTHAWVEPDTVTIVEVNRDFCKKVEKAMGELCDVYHSPFEYLTNNLDLTTKPEVANEKQSAFTAWLYDTFPENECDHVHHTESCLPLVTEADEADTPATVVHIAALGIKHGCSSKPPPGRKLFMELIEQFMVAGFVTTTQPLKCTQPESLAHQNFPALWTAPPGKMPLGIQSLGYIKGRARVTSVMTLLLWMKNMGYTKGDIKKCHPVLYSSLLKVHIYHQPQDSKMGETLKNMELSVAGAIRKAPNVVLKMDRNISGLPPPHITIVFGL